MYTSNQRRCQNEIQGETKDKVFPSKEGFPYTEFSRDCSILHSNDITKKDRIETEARSRGVQMSSRRCPFYSSGTCQQDCPYFR